jgi:hypothetical protein
MNGAAAAVALVAEVQNGVALELLMKNLFSVGFVLLGPVLGRRAPMPTIGSPKGPGSARRGAAPGRDRAGTAGNA